MATTTTYPTSATAPSGATTTAQDVMTLVGRVLVALLGAASADYVRTPINTRQRHGLKLG